MDYNEHEHEKELIYLNSLLDKYTFFNKNKNNTNFIQVASLNKLIDLAFIDETFYLQYKIQDIIYFGTKILELNKDIENNYDDYANLKYLYLQEYESKKKSLHIFNDESQELIKDAIVHAVGEEIIKHSNKELQFFSSIISSFREFNNELKAAKIIKRISPNDKNFNSLKRAMQTVSEYYGENKEKSKKLLIENDLKSIENIHISNADNIIKRKFDTNIIENLLSYFSDGPVKVQINGDTYTKYKNQRIKFKKEKQQSKKLSNIIKDQLVHNFNDLQVNYIF
jgi:hypothetical protein